MNRKIIFSLVSDEQFEIRLDSCYGYRVYQILSETEAKPVSRYLKSVPELVDSLVELAIFSGDDAVALVDIRYAIEAVALSLEAYRLNYC